MKRIGIAALCSTFAVLIAIFLNDVHQFNKEQKRLGEQYVFFSGTYSDSLKIRLERNGISYTINPEGQLMIKRKDQDKAVACCT